ncbi:MAG: HD domain-containing phosphohydrolase [Spirochaetia bacterium]|jgi:PAS domain S-box-containing protein
MQARLRELDDLLKRLVGQGSLPQRRTMILEWTLSSLALDGIALLQAGRGPAGGVETRASLGSLSAIAPLLAAELSWTGIPTKQGTLPLPPGSDRHDALLCCPLNVENGTPWSALVLQGPHIEEIARARAEYLLAAAAHLRDILETERGKAPFNEGPVHASDLPPNLALHTEGLRLPLYVCDLQGRFSYASPAFLELTGYTSLEALAQSQGFFREPEKRAAELERMQNRGRVESFPLAMTTGSGGMLQVRDSAVSLGNSILGVFFDVTELLATNAELQEALQVQELLHDDMLASAKASQRTQDVLQRTQGAAIRSLARLAEYRDPETGYHLQRICEYTRLIAMQVHLRAPYSFRITAEYANDISLSVTLHDIGKVSIPDHILLKPGKLDPEEWEMMKKHAVFGWEVLHKADRELGEQSFLTLAASIARSHHERFDGKGYPEGAAGDQIHLSARIAAIADVYDALTTARPYKEAWSHERAVAEILGQAGIQFDPVLVAIFRDLNDQFADVRRRFPG